MNCCLQGLTKPSRNFLKKNF
uniref:Uncharacterized protein n=1 Tax=Arundo donax TaxID=35708 RepID=A0A0A8ZHK6_ARUDO